MSNELTIYQENGIELFSSYEEFKEKAGQRLAEEAESMVWTRWTLGAHVKAILDDACYGDRKAEDLEGDLSLSKKTLYACKTMFERFTRNEMESKIIPLGLSFRALNYLARVGDDDRRDGYMKLLSEGEIKSEDIPSLEQEAKVAGATETTATDDGPSRTAKKALSDLRKPVKTAVSYLERAENIISSDMSHALGLMDIIAEDKELYDSAVEELTTLRDTAWDMSEKLQTLKETLDRYVLA